MPMTTHPMAFAELMASVRFSCCCTCHLAMFDNMVPEVNYLKYSQLCALVDDSLINCVGGCKVYHLAKDDAVVHLLIHVTASVLQI